MSTAQADKYVAVVLSFGERATVPVGSRYLAAAGGQNLASELAIMLPRGGTLE